MDVPVREKVTYWASQNVRSGFSTPSYGKIQTNFLANPISEESVQETNYTRGALSPPMKSSLPRALRN